jgi:guanine deaminase
MAGVVEWMRFALDLAVRNVEAGGGPFAALVLQDGRKVAEGVNSVTRENDPTAHAEVVAIRTACRQLGAFRLSGCELVTTCEPCPMCLGAIYWARLDRVYYAADQQAATESGFDDSLIYQEFARPRSQRRIPLIAVEGVDLRAPFVAWERHQTRILY